MDWCSVYLAPQGLPKYIYLSPPLIFPTTYDGFRTKNHPVWITPGAAPIRWMGPIRNPRWEQKWTEGYVIVSTVTWPTLSIFTQNSDNHFCCLISSNVLFIQPLAFCRNWEQRRQKNCVTLVKQLQNEWRLTGNFKNEIPESDSGTTISSFVDSKKKLKNWCRPTLDFFDMRQ
jgi:hypothetical protein